MDPLLVATIVFVITYAIIATERIHKTLAALAGAIVMIMLNIVPQHQAFKAVDWNVIFLLTGMMIIAGIMRQTGVFQWLAIRSAKAAGGEPFRIMVLLTLLTAVASAFLDNVTTVVLIAPVTLLVAASLQISPIPFLVAEVMASNIGGTATLIGDPPNIMVGSAAGLDFVAFVIHLTPVVIIAFILFIPTVRFLFRGQLRADPELRAVVMGMDENEVITDPVLLRKSLIVLGLVILGFMLHGAFGYEPATIALAGAVLLTVIGGLEPHQVLHEVEWPTIFFFIGLFIAVEGIVEVGLIDLIAQAALDLTGGSLALTSLIVLWMSGILSGIIDNIPYTATMIPFIRQVGQHIEVGPLWWSLALGACLGGNFTIIGASANVLVANIAERAGYPISFGGYLKYGILVSMETLIISTFYIYLRYLL